MTRQTCAVLGMFFLAHAAEAQLAPQGSKLVATGAVGAAYQGYSVAISDNPQQSRTDPARVRRHLRAARCSYAISPTRRSHGAGEETGSFQVTADAGCAWNVSSDSAWLSITSGSSGTGTGTVTYTVAANTGTGSRTGTITVQGQAFAVIQAGAGSPDEITVYLGPSNTVPLVLVRIPAGTFVMGAAADEPYALDWDKPQHTVTLSQSYYLGKTEVTRGQWRTVTGADPPNDCEGIVLGTGDEYPASCVSWVDVCGLTSGSTCAPDSFIGKVNALLGTTTFRMPTEAEWERAARGGASTSTPFSFPTPASWHPGCGSFLEADPYMWWCGNSDSPYTSAPGTRPVGTKLPNPYGLHDIHGNVWEWVSDWHGPYPSGSQTDPPGAEGGEGRVIRSGGWQLYARYCRTAARALGDPYQHKDSNGFRLASSQ